MKIVHGLAALLMTLLMVGCNSSDDTIEYVLTVDAQPQYNGVTGFVNPLTVNAYKADGQWVSAGMVEGFAPAFGTAYEIRVVESEVSDPPADGSSIRIELIEIISSEADAVGTLYSYSDVELIGNPFYLSNSGAYMFYQYAFECAETVDCDALVDMGDSGGLVDVEFEYTGGETPITLVGWN